MDYQIKTLGTVATYVNGRAFKPSEWEECGLPIIRIQNLTNSFAPFNYTSAEHDNRFLVKKGDLLFAWSASLGAHIWKGEDAWLNQHIFKVIPDEDIDRDYLYYYLLRVVSDLYAKTHGSGMVHITKGPFMATKIPVPLITHQKRIVARIEELFSQLDSGVETLKKVKWQLAVYQQAIYSSFFNNIDNMRPITDFFDISGGLTKNSNRNSLPFKRRYLRVANVYYNLLDLSEIKEIGVTAAEIEKCTLQKNDILFVEGNGSKSQIGRVAIWDGSVEDCLHQNHLIKGRPLGGMIPEFALYYLISGYGRNQIMRIASSTSGLYTLSLNKVKGLQVPYCDKGVQQSIVSEIIDRISVCDRIEQTVDTALQQAEAMRQSILKKAFEGGL